MNDNFMPETLTQVLSKKLGKLILTYDCQTTQLHGGTLGDVKLIEGMAKAADGMEEPFSLVWKKQRKWKRPGDPKSWRREYDLCVSGLSTAFSESFRMPECFHAEISDDDIQIWMEYIGGVSGKDLTVEMLEQAARELGCFQGRILTQHDNFKGISYLSDEGFMEREFNQWHTQSFTYGFLVSEQCRIPPFLKQMLKKGDIELVEGKSFEYSYLRSRGYDMPLHLKKMLADIDDNRDMLFDELKKLPVVFCHRDFWIENIFFSDGKIVLIDWDGAGLGYTGEDIASLIVDDTEPKNQHEYFRRLIPAYFQGISEFPDIPPIANRVIWEMIVIKFGYRIMQDYMFTTSDNVKRESVNRLQKIYEMKDM